MSLNQPHLAVYPGALVHPEGRDIEAICGVTVRAAIVIQGNEVVICRQKWRSFASSLNCCPKCLQALDDAVLDPPEILRISDRWHIYAILDRFSRAGQRAAGRLEESA